MKRNLLLFIIVLTLLLTLSAPAWAQEPQEPAFEFTFTPQQLTYSPGQTVAYTLKLRQTTGADQVGSLVYRFTYDTSKLKFNGSNADAITILDANGQLNPAVTVTFAAQEFDGEAGVITVYLPDGNIQPAAGYDNVQTGSDAHSLLTYGYDFSGAGADLITLNFIALPTENPTAQNTDFAKADDIAGAAPIRSLITLSGHQQAAPAATVATDKITVNTYPLLTAEDNANTTVTFDNACYSEYADVKYAKPGAPISFTVTRPAGYLFKSVAYSINNGEPVDLTPQDSAVSSVSPDQPLQANQSVTVAAVALPDVTIKAFTKSSVYDDQSVLTHFSNLVSGNTLVLLRAPTLDENVADLSVSNDLACEGDIARERIVYRLPAGAYGDDYTHALLVGVDAITVDANTTAEQINAAMTAYLLPKLSVASPGNTNPTFTYDGNTNGLGGVDLLDLQAAYDFYTLDQTRMRWLPSFDLLLKADVCGQAGAEARDGQITWEDVNAFLQRISKD